MQSLSENLPQTLAGSSERAKEEKREAKSMAAPIGFDWFTEWEVGANLGKKVVKIDIGRGKM
jgi:hypothetical protein